MTYRTVYAALPIVALGALIVLPGSAAALISTSLDFGDRSAEVTELQTYLATDASIYPEGLVTGYFGSLTQAAVERFQCAHGIVCSGTPATTGYGRVGPQTRASLNAQMNGNGSVGGDVSAPIMSSAVVATTSNTATISWTTNEAARGRVLYGTAWPFLYATAPSVADTTVDATSAVTISGLMPNTTYFFVRESVDVGGNVMWTTARELRTASQ